jgi:hypothetical protein
VREKRLPLGFKHVRLATSCRRSGITVSLAAGIPGAAAKENVDATRNEAETATHDQAT